jgi:adenine deaminase
MVDEAQDQPIHIWVQMPSCVPSAPGLETPGATIGPKEVEQAMNWKRIIGLGEMMNYPAVAKGNGNLLEEMSITHAHNKTIGGHYASPDLGLPFHGYVAGGAEDDHEGVQLEDAVERVRQGMKAMLRYGSSWHDVASQVGAITHLGLDPRRFILVTDDSHAQTISHEGHMDRVLRHAIGQGLSPMTAIQMLTINTAEHFGLAREMGMIAPGRWADVLLVKDLDNFKADMVIAKGRVIAQNGKWTVDLPKYTYPSWATNSVKLKKPLRADDYKIQVKINSSNAKANIIGVIESQAPTRHLICDVQVVDGEVQANPEQDIAKIALVQRHSGMSGVSMGLVSGFGFTAKCAVASTVAHDCHHMIVVGTDDESMAVAANALVGCGGGQVVVKNGKVIGQVELKIAGLMSEERADVVAKKAETLLKGFRSCGCQLNNPNMQLSLLALVVIPELRISDLGLVDVNQFKVVPLLEG